MKRIFLLVFIYFSLLFASEPVLFILDASGSMWGRLNNVEKIITAKSVLVDLVNSMDDDIQMGLMVYGHRTKGDCDDIELLFHPRPHIRADMIQSIQRINPKGKTPIQRSIAAAAELADTHPMSVVLISDGKENCDDNPCEFLQHIKSTGVRITLHVIGFDVAEDEKVELTCLADAGGGQYYTADSADELRSALFQIKENILPEQSGLGLLVVTGEGKDLYSVYNADGSEKVTTAATNTSVELPAGTYRVKLGRVYQHVQVTSGKETKLCSGSVVVQGLGKELYAVFDVTGEQKFDFTRTNKKIEVLSGSYLIEMNGTRRTIVIECEDTTVLQASAVKVVGTSESLYAVYDPTGQHKYQFTRVNKPIEVLPGFYSIQIGDRWIHDVELEEGEVLEIEE